MNAKLFRHVRGRLAGSVLLVLALLWPTALLAEAEPPSLPELDLAAGPPVDLAFEQPTSLREVYAVIGETLGINVLFDARFKDQNVTLALDAVPPDRVLEILSGTVGHFYKILDERTILVADDTPQNRRTYEEQLVQTFYVEHSDLRDLMTILRSLLGAKHIALNQPLNALVVRDTAAKVRLAEELIRAHDRARAMVSVGVELFAVEPEALDSVAGLSPRSEDVPLRLDADGLLQLRQEAGVRSLTQAQLSGRSGHRIELDVTHQVPAGFHTASDDSNSSHNVGLDLEITPEYHSSLGQITLGVHLGLSYLDSLPRTGRAATPIPTSRALTSEVRVSTGETVLLSGLWSIAGCPSDSADRTLALLAPSECAADEVVTRHLMLALSPRVSELSTVTGRDRLPIAIGSEASITYPKAVAAAHVSD